jgi:hypothetical protein
MQSEVGDVQHAVFAYEMVWKSGSVSKGLSIPVFHNLQQLGRI